MSNRLPKNPNQVKPSFQFDDDDEAVIEKKKEERRIALAESLRATQKERFQEIVDKGGARSRGMRFNDEDYRALREGQKTTREKSVAAYVMRMHEERKDIAEMRRVLKGIDRRFSDLELYVKEEFRKFQATFEVAE